jgi:hypothetical protein
LAIASRSRGRLGELGDPLRDVLHAVLGQVVVGDHPALIDELRSRLERPRIRICFASSAGGPRAAGSARVVQPRRPRQPPSALGSFWSKCTVIV